MLFFARKSSLFFSRRYSKLRQGPVFVPHGKRIRRPKRTHERRNHHLAEPIISVRDLKKIYRVGDSEVHALDGISFDLEPGRFLAIVGTSGSGKSTCLNLLAGLEPPSSGSIHILGEKLEKMNEQQLVRFRRNHVGFIFQSYGLIPTMNAEENVALPLLFRGVDKEERQRTARTYMERIGILDQALHMPGQMSGGQQQRVGIARALASKPELIFADEPTGNLDSRTTEEVLSLLRDIVREQHVTLVMVTHDNSIAARADQQIRIVDGKIVERKGFTHAD
jgi:ABC transporter, ATP-binding protein